MNILNYLIKVAILATLYFLFGTINNYISIDTGINTINIFIPEGIALASVLLYGRNMWLGVFIGQTLLLYYSNIPLNVSIWIGIIHAIEAVIAFELFKYFKLDKKLSTIHDIVGLILLIVLVLQPFSATFGNLILVYFGVMKWSNYFNSWLFWGFGNIMGQLLIAPMLLLMYAHIKPKQVRYFILVATFFTIMTYISIAVLPIDNPFILLGFTLFVIFVLSYKAGIHYGAFATVIITAVALYLTHKKIGLFVKSSDIDNIINLNSYVLFQIIFLLFIGTLLADNHRKTKRLKQLVAQEIEKNKEQQFHMLQQNRLSLQGEMISMIAHQWKQPLNNLSLIKQMLIMEYKQGKLNDEIIDEFNKESSRQIKQMSQTISDFTNFFSPEKKAKYFYLRDILYKSLSFLKPVLVNTNITIETNFEYKKPISLKGYPNELGQTIINILNNAKDALVEKQIKDKRVYIDIKEEEKNIIITIEDNAGGIPTDIMPKIFDPYFSTKSKNGTGLGLYMSKMIIEEHMHGHILVRNSDKGAVFEIRLPMQLN